MALPMFPFFVTTLMMQGLIETQLGEAVTPVSVGLLIVELPTFTPNERPVMDNSKFVPL